jgi:hypothetical protein
MPAATMMLGFTKNDVGHGDKGRQAGGQLNFYRGVVLAEFKQPFQQAYGRSASGIIGLRWFATFHCAVLLIAFILITEWR